MSAIWRMEEYKDFKNHIISSLKSFLLKKLKKNLSLSPSQNKLINWFVFFVLLFYLIFDKFLSNTNTQKKFFFQKVRLIANFEFNYLEEHLTRIKSINLKIIHNSYNLYFEQFFLISLVWQLYFSLTFWNNILHHKRNYDALSLPYLKLLRDNCNYNIGKISLR